MIRRGIKHSLFLWFLPLVLYVYDVWGKKGLYWLSIYSERVGGQKALFGGRKYLVGVPKQFRHTRIHQEVAGSGSLIFLLQLS